MFKMRQGEFFFFQNWYLESAQKTTISTYFPNIVYCLLSVKKGFFYKVSAFHFTVL